MQLFADPQEIYSPILTFRSRLWWVRLQSLWRAPLARARDTRARNKQYSVEHGPARGFGLHESKQTSSPYNARQIAQDER